MTPYYAVYRDILKNGKTVRKYLRRPILDGKNWSWTTKVKTAARFQDFEQAERYAQSYADAHALRVQYD